MAALDLESPHKSTDIISVLKDQHELIKSLLNEVAAAAGTERQQKFDHLRALLAVHEIAEEMLLRPLTTGTAGSDVVEARNAEEKEGREQLALLEEMDIGSGAFAAAFEEFRQATLTHAANEESEEFPTLLEGTNSEERERLGAQLLTVEGLAPTHLRLFDGGSSDNETQVVPYASMVDRMRDNFTGQVR